MRFSIATVVVSVVALFATQGLALNITVGSKNYTAVDVITPATLTGASGPGGANCTDQCNNNVLKAFNNCGTNDTCTCSNATAVQMQQCEQCHFNALIEQNIRPSSPLVGSTPVLSAFVSACAAINITIAAPAPLLLPLDVWAGPESLKLSTPVTVIYLIGGVTLAFGSFYTLFNIQ